MFTSSRNNGLYKTTDMIINELKWKNLRRNWRKHQQLWKDLPGYYIFMATAELDSQCGIRTLVL